MTVYLVGLESPPHPDNELFIKVTDDYDGFGPNLMSTPRPEWITTEFPQDAAWFFALGHGLLSCRAIVNLPGEETSTWFLGHDRPELEED